MCVCYRAHKYIIHYAQCSIIQNIYIHGTKLLWLHYLIFVFAQNIVGKTSFMVQGKTVKTINVLLLEYFVLLYMILCSHYYLGTINFKVNVALEYTT